MWIYFIKGRKGILKVVVVLSVELWIGGWLYKFYCGSNWNGLKLETPIAKFICISHFKIYFCNVIDMCYTVLFCFTYPNEKYLIEFLQLYGAKTGKIGKYSRYIYLKTIQKNQFKITFLIFIKIKLQNCVKMQ